jgi:signal transduction histidine kinase/ligand-binding sensor domain-containing protein/DNA-binding response OmpR family regulator
MTQLRIIALLIVLAGIFEYADARPDNLRFERFLLNEKLPSNSVNRLYHDKEGFMWLGTKDGLCRFDGYDIKVFRTSAITPGKLRNNDINFITEDQFNRIWVGTFEGINIIDKRNFSVSSLNIPYLQNERINYILNDSQGMMWVATSNYGVLRIDPKTEEYVRYSSDSDSPIKLKRNSVSQVYEDKEGRIWLALWNNGLSYIDPEKNTITHAPEIGSKNNPFRIFQDSKGEYWVCSWGDGIFKAEIDERKQIKIKSVPLSPKSEKVIDEIVYSITEDKAGRIWLVTFTGLDVLEKDENNQYIVYNGNQLFNDEATGLFHTIIRDNRDNLWLGSVGEGVFQMDFNKLPIRNYPLNEIKQYNAQPYVTRICQTSSNQLFLVINRIGLFHFNLNTQAISRPTDPVLRKLKSIIAIIYHRQSGELWVGNEGDKEVHIFNVDGSNLTHKETVDIPDPSYSTENSLMFMQEDRPGNLWIGTINGLYVKQPGQKIRLVDENLHLINDIKIDQKGRIWVGTEKDGLFCLQSDKNSPSGYSQRKISLKIKDYESISVQSILCRKNGNLFIATKEGGLYVYDIVTGKAEDISSVYGISEEGFLDMTEDNLGNIWLTTLKRIIRYNPETHASTYYSTSDGILVSAFFKNALLKLNSGELLFGGNNGLCSFSTDVQAFSSRAANVVVRITDILIQNKSLYDIESAGKFDAEKNSVILKHRENSLSIEFSALDHAVASKIQYAYRISGIDKDWNYTGNNRRFVSYSNLTPGTYTFQVKASDENGVWSNHISSLRITVKPPLYQTWWAQVIYVIIFIIIVYVLTNTVANRIRLRNELKISNIEKLKTEELTQIKLRYFTNISHELLTPLTVIMLQIESLQKRLLDHTVQFDIIKDNVMRLKRLIKQILVFRKTESGNMKLRVLQSDVVAFVRNICHSSFNPQVTENEINFTVDIQYASYQAYFDPDKLDKIIYNILSNAFKYTPKGGSIAVKMSFVPRGNEVIMRLSVSDTGIGIPEHDLPHIFRRFYISSTSDQSQSHGIGLSLTHDLLEIHHGKIEVMSQVGEGSVFTIEIPVSETAYAPEEKLNDDDNVPDEDNQALKEQETAPNEDEIATDLMFNILVVEDNKGLNKLIAENFADKYRVFTAENGLQGLQIVKDQEIDLIISDVMMPEMDGLTFCKIIKNDLNTSHIAVLMLTAKNSAEDRIECYNAGADAFIAKPFELGVLNARVKNLIGKIRQKAEKFQHGVDINISSMEYNSIDEVFLKSAVNKVEEKLSEETFDFDQFAIDMATSKSTLHRKLKSLTGLSPGEFIRNIRMKHAVQMLNNNIGNISEIAYAVGFNDPKYFSRCFKAEFGMTPKEWMDQNRKKK